MKKIIKPSPIVFPAPAVMVSCGNDTIQNIITISWVGNINSVPPMCSISVRPERFSYSILKETNEFVINLPTVELLAIVDWCGLKSGRDFDKFKEMKLTPQQGKFTKAPIILESPVNIECSIKQSIALGSHEMFIAEIVGIQIDSQFLTDKNTVKWNEINHLVYCGGTYLNPDKIVGKNGFSIR